MVKKKTKNGFLKKFDKVWFTQETEYFIFILWGVFVCVFLIQFI